MTSRPPIRIGLLLVFALSPGCGDATQLGQIEGTVVASGQPLPNVLVTFIPDENGSRAHVRSMGVTDEMGCFRLKTEQQEEGALVGRHRVIVEDLAIYAAPRSTDGTVLKHPPQRFPPRYSDPLQTPLVRDVAAGSQKLVLELDGDSISQVTKP